MREGSGAGVKSDRWGGGLGATRAAAALALVVMVGCSESPREWGSVQVINAVQSPFATAAAMDDNGATLHTVPFACAPSASCLLPLPQDVVSRTAAMQFRDNLGRLVGAYPKANLGRTGYSVTVDADMTGVELFNRLVAQGVYTPATLIHLADEHLYREYPAGDRPSFFADLQAHYQRGLADPAYNEQKYFDDVLKAIAERNGGQTSAVTTGPAAQGVVLKSNTSSCDPAWKGINTIVGFGAKVSGVTGATMIEGLSNIIGGACNNGAFTDALKDITSTLSKVQDQLKGIDTKLTALGVNLNQLAADAAFRNFQTRYDAFSDQLKNLKEVVNVYKAVLSPTSTVGHNPPRYVDLSGYIGSVGGLSAATYSDNKSLNKILGDLSKTVTNYYELVSLNKASNMIADLYTLCRTSSTIVGDVIGRRDACTMWAMQVINEASAVALELRVVVSDAYTVIGKAYGDASGDVPKTNWLSGNFPNDLKPGVSSWEETKVQVVKDIWTALDLFVGEMSKSVFVDTALGTTLAPVPPTETPPDGLDPTLLNNIKLVGCSKSFQGKSLAAIENWVVQAAQPSPYVTTRCQGRNDELVYSRFHYTTDVGPNKTVLNMLGVLIKPEKVVESWNRVSYECCSGDLIGGTSSGYYQERVCLDGGDGRCDWWMVVPGVKRAVVKTMSDGVVKETTVGFNQVRSHTSLVSDTAQQKVPVNETFLYNPPINDRILYPVTKPMGRDAGYQPDASSQYLFGSRWTVSPGTGDLKSQDYQDGYLTYTWVTDERAWKAVPDRRYTRTVALKVGQLRMRNADKASWDTFVAYRCVTSDCKQPQTSFQEGSTFIYTDGPRIQWNFFMEEWGRWHMFVDGKSSDGRIFPERR